VKHSAWPEEADKRTSELARAGLSLTEIAREMGLTVWNVRIRANKLGISVARGRKIIPKRIRS
jgi:hypothetical protein